MSVYQIKHRYDVGGISIVYIDFLEALQAEKVRSLAVYLQFKAEEVLDDTVTLDNVTIAQFLELQGAQILDKVPEEFIEIDMYYDRSLKSGGRWQEFDLYDQKYGQQAVAFLMEKSKGKSLKGAVI